MTDILQAARSYYGLADTESCTTQLFTNQAGQTCVAFEIPLSNEDFAAIVQRMQSMQQPDTQPDTAIIECPTVEAMREAYNALSKAEKGRYGSFARYMAESSSGIVDMPAAKFQGYIAEGSETEADIKRQVVHVDALEELEPTNMDAVWLSTYEATEAQKMHCIDTNNRVTDGALIYLVQWAMLTDEQKQKAKP